MGIFSAIGEWWDRVTGKADKGTANPTQNKAIEGLETDPTFGGFKNTVSPTPTATPPPAQKPTKPSKYE